MNPTPITNAEPNQCPPNKHVMLYFGSFNPVHKGHMAVAEWVIEHGMCDEVWFVVSPQNPHKETASLAAENNRLEMVRLAVEDSPCARSMRVCDIEFGLPRPSYTADTLMVLRQRYPDVEFSLLVGGDIPAKFHSWRRADEIAAHHNIYVYPRRGYDISHLEPPFMVIEGAPYEDFSSTEVRNGLAADPNNNMLTDNVMNYIKNKNLWQTK